MNSVNQQIFGTSLPILMAGPCVIENEDLCMGIAETMTKLSGELGFYYIFKASFDKANRTDVNSFRGPGLEEGLKVLSRIKSTFDIPVITDIHIPDQAPVTAEVVDVLQIPAFLCRQTDLLVAAGETGRVVSIKKGQFLAPEDMQYAVNKVKSTGNDKIYLTERGTTFGYNNLVVDYRSLAIIKKYAGTIFDITHSIQKPGGLGGKSGGNREYATYLARAAAAVGVDGYFLETHPNPDKALSDGPNMIPLSEVKNFLLPIKQIHNIIQENE